MPILQRQTIIHNIITLLLAVFFLYFVIIGGTCSSLLHCRLQKYITQSLLFKHVLMFLSIMVFSFVLNWYSPESVFPQWNNQNLKNDDLQNDNIPLPEQQLIQWLSCTLIIYLFVLLLNKCEWPYFVVVFILLFAIFGLFTSLKMYSYKYAHQMKSKHKASFSRLESAIFYVFFIMCTVLLVGVYVYYKRQSTDNATNWNWITFFFAGCNEKIPK